MNIHLISVLYLILGILISFIISYNYLKHYPRKNVKFAFYSSVFIFGLIIFFIFLIPYDIASSAMSRRKGSNRFLDALPMYYLVFGYFSKVVGYLIAPILILINTTGFYRKCDITKNVIKRFIKLYVSFIKVIIVVILSIPTIILVLAKDINVFKFFKTILLYLNFFPYLKILYYIGFVCQDFVYSFIRKKRLYAENYDIWKLGKIFKYYNREKKIVNERYKKITQEIEKAHNDYNLNLPEDFKIHFALFKANVENTQRNLLIIKSEREKVYLATKEYKDEKMSEIKGRNKNILNDSIDNSFDANENDMIEEMFKQAKKDEDELEDDIDYEVNYDNDNYFRDENDALMPDKISENNNLYSTANNRKDSLIKGKIIDKQFKNWKSFKYYICDLMTDVNESSISVQRKSYLINTKGVEILSIEAGMGKDNPNSCIFLPIILFYLMLFFFEMPWSIYDWFPPEIKKNFYGNLFVSLVSIVFYFFIFNYAVICHRYMSGNLLFGKNLSGNVNFYNFIIYVLGNCDAIFYHSVWVLRKYKIDEKKIDPLCYFYDYNHCYYFYPEYSKVFELPEVRFHGIDIIPYISMFVIIISIFNSAKFSNIKICRKEVVLFNENADFFYNEKNLYSNFILGCGVLIFIKKNMDNIIKNGYV